MAGIIAKGETQVYNIEHIDRGYENIEQKFRNLGANIKELQNSIAKEEYICLNFVVCIVAVQEIVYL